MAVPTAEEVTLKRTGWESRRSPRVSEIWKLTGGSGGSSDGDEVAITTRMKKPALVLGPVSATISGQVVTAKLITALAQDELLHVEIMGYPA